MGKQKDEYISQTEEKNDDLVDINEPAPSSERLKNSLKSFLGNFRIHKSSSKRKKPFKFNTRILFAVLAALCAALIILTSVSDSFAAPFRSVVSVFVVPAQKGINSIGTFVSDLIEQSRDIEELTEENEQLKEEIKKLEEENSYLQSKSEQVDELNELLELKNLYSDYETTAANVVAKDSSSWFSTFTIDKGSLDGIEENMNVVYEGGLVGVVSEVGLNYSTVTSIINDGSNISAMLKDTNDICVVSGNLSLMSSNLMEFSDFDASAALYEGAEVVTSNVSSIYLPGILIGYISEYELDGNGLTQSGYITPAVNFDNLTQVLIIKQLKETSD